MAIPYPPISKLPSLPARDLAKLLDQLFERAPALHTLSLPLLSSQTFDSYPALIAAVGSQLTSLFQSSSANDAAQLDDILAAHPRLGEKVDSEQSRYEQAQMNAHSGGDDEHERLRVANEDYERAFPGESLGRIQLRSTHWRDADE
ncbi:MAG: hypothetical protein M1814_003085 [Vezdaea aestivalis]|nr:MAG: hypothetical protein M1814_003085 [Vezdaea aestivalis]